MSLIQPHLDGIAFPAYLKKSGSVGADDVEMGLRLLNGR